MCVLSAVGAVITEEMIPNTRECLLVLAARFPRATFIMETGTHSPWVSRLLEAEGHRVIVANARKLRAISESHTKNDTEDARMLARLGRADEALLSPIKHRSESGQRALVRLKVREALVRARVNAMNSVRFLLKSLGVLVASGSEAMTFTRRPRPMLDDATRGLVEPLLTLTDSLNAQIAEMDRELEAFGQEQYPVTERLRQVDGVGPLTALAFVLTIEDPGRFPHTRHV
ncbi:MAG TPA: transposase, partial [Candidatus Synoicihabitans sp.]|nr:transposase [Candidatus Synoicihabitans sp.]